MKCEPCKDNLSSETGEATKLMPQSTNKGKNITYMAVCDNHAVGWWDGADWNGKDFEINLMGGNYEIGKLLNGEPDPCYTCKNSDTESCDYCDNYNQYVA